MFTRNQVLGLGSVTGIVLLLASGGRPALAADPDLPLAALEQRLAAGGNKKDAAFFGVADAPATPPKGAALRGVAQWIEGAFYSWDEAEAADGTRYLWLRKPVARPLTAGEAATLLSGSRLWVEHGGKELASAAAAAPSVDDLGVSSDRQDTRIGAAVAPADGVKLIVGGESRELVTNRFVFPWNTVAFTQFRRPTTGQTERASAVIVSPYAALTAASAVYDVNADSFNGANFLWVAIHDDGQGNDIQTPYGRIPVESRSTFTSYTENGSVTHDVGALRLPAMYPDVATYMPVVFDADATILNVMGYPEQVNGVTSFSPWRDFGSAASQGGYWEFDADTSYGMEGGPVWKYVDQDQSRSLVGVYSRGGDGNNLAARFDSDKRETMEGWLSYVPSEPVFHDDFNEPTFIVDDVFVTSSNVFCTKQPGEPNHAGNAGGASVWFIVIPTVTGNYTLNTQGSNFDTTLAVYGPGTDISGLNEIASNDDNNNLLSSVTFFAEAGVEYNVAVDGFNGETGRVQLNVIPPSGGPSPTPTVAPPTPSPNPTAVQPTASPTPSPVPTASLTPSPTPSPSPSPSPSLTPSPTASLTPTPSLTPSVTPTPSPTPPPPQPPTNVVAIPSANSVFLRWDPTVSPHVRGYVVEWERTDGAAVDNGERTAYSTEFLHSDLDPGSTYEYTVKASDGNFIVPIETPVPVTLEGTPVFLRLVADPLERDRLYLQINMSNASGYEATGFNLRVLFPEGMMRPSGRPERTFLSRQMDVLNIVREQYVDVVGNVPQDTVVELNGAGSLVTIPFQKLATSGTGTLSLASFNLTDIDGNPDPLPPPEDVEVNFAAIPLRGDVNGDGLVNAADVNAAQEQAIADDTLAKTGAEAGLADVNGDGQITVADAVMLQRLIEGETLLPPDTKIFNPALLQADLTLPPAAITCDGNEITIDLDLAGTAAADAAGSQLVLTFDQDKVEYLGGNSQIQAFPVNSNNSGSSKLRIAGSDKGALGQERATVRRMTFRIKEGAPSDLYFGMGGGIISGEYGNHFQWGGSVALRGLLVRSCASGEATASYLLGRAGQPSLEINDLNVDGVVDSADLKIAIQNDLQNEQWPPE